MDLFGWVGSFWRVEQDLRSTPGARVLGLNPEQRFIVEIVKAVAANPRCLFWTSLPSIFWLRMWNFCSAALGTRGVRRRRCLYFHRIREVRRIAQRFTVLRDGHGRGTYDAAGLSEQHIVELIVGRAVDSEFPPKSADTASDIVFEVDLLSGRGFRTYRSS